MATWSNWIYSNYVIWMVYDGIFPYLPGSFYCIPATKTFCSIALSYSLISNSRLNNRSRQKYIYLKWPKLYCKNIWNSESNENNCNCWSSILWRFEIQFWVIFNSHNLRFQTQVFWQQWPSQLVATRTFRAPNSTISTTVEERT